MPDYRKKKHNKLFSAPKPKKSTKTEKSENIKMTPAERYRKTAKQNMKVVRGKKIEQKRRLRVSLCAILIIAVIFTLFEIALPKGVFETVSQTISLMGTGSYPVSLEGNRTLNTANKGNYYYVLSDTHLTALSSAGKTVFSYPHGFENPILKTSTSNAIVFEQNGNRAFVFNLNGLKNEITSKTNIITAAISEKGSYAICSKSDKYACKVTVFNKRDKQVYEWYSAENMVNNIALSKNGKKIAVASFKSENGQFKSTLSILNYKSATPLYTENFDNGLIYSLDNSKNRLAVVTENSVKFIKWSSFKANEYKSDFKTALFRSEKNGFVVVFNRLNDKTANHIVLFSNSGKVKYKFDFSGIISDIALSGSHIYLMSETDLYLLGKEGEILRKANCDFGSVRISVTSSNTVAVISDNSINKVKIEQE
ncbi:MAG: hypothetical protein IJP34_06830 [Clostridia bacterium]|nr:hypothetical protein [Clostridia bacterium]